MEPTHSVVHREVPVVPVVELGLEVGRDIYRAKLGHGQVLVHELQKTGACVSKTRMGILTPYSCLAWPYLYPLNLAWLGRTLIRRRYPYSYPYSRQGLPRIATQTKTGARLLLLDLLEERADVQRVPGSAACLASLAHNAVPPLAQRRRKHRVELVPPPAQRLRDARRVQELRTRTRALQRRRSALQTLLLRCCRRPSRSASCLTLPCIRQLLRAQVVSPTPRRAIARRVMPSRGRRRKGAGRRCGVTCEPTAAVGATGASADELRLSMCDRARYPTRHVALRTHRRRSPLRCRAVPRRRCVARTRLKPSSVYALAYGRKCADMNSANLCSIGHALFLLKWTCAIRTCRNSGMS